MVHNSTIALLVQENILGFSSKKKKKKKKKEKKKEEVNLDFDKGVKGALGINDSKVESEM